MRLDQAEREWVLASRAGDRDAFGRLVERYQHMVFQLARRMLDNPEEARDVAQDTFIRAYTHLDSFHSDQPFRPWLLRIASNLCLDRLRRARRQPLPLLDAFVDANPANDPAATAIERDRQVALRRAIAALPDEYRLLIVLAHLQQRSYQEIMQITGLSLTLVKNRLYRARLMLREAMEPAPALTGGVRP